MVNLILKLEKQVYIIFCIDSNIYSSVCKMHRIHEEQKFDTNNLILLSI